MKKFLLLFVFCMWPMAHGADLAPVFIKVGKTYMAPTVTSGMPFKVVELGSDGWVRIEPASHLPEWKHGPVWLNTSVIPVMIEVEPVDADRESLLEKQKQTMADMRAAATSCEAYAVDNNVYPGAGPQKKLEEISAALVPVYIRKLPAQDAWEHSYAYLTTPDLQHYWIISYGVDGTPDNALYDSSGMPIGLDPEGKDAATSDPSADIIFSDGQFIRFPESTNDSDF